MKQKKKKIKITEDQLQKLYEVWGTYYLYPQGDATMTYKK